MTIEENRDFFVIFEGGRLPLTAAPVYCHPGAQR